MRKGECLSWVSLGKAAYALCKSTCSGLLGNPVNRRIIFHNEPASCVVCLAPFFLFENPQKFCATKPD